MIQTVCLGVRIDKEMVHWSILNSKFLIFAAVELDVFSSPLCLSRGSGKAKLQQSGHVSNMTCTLTNLVLCPCFLTKEKRKT